MISSVFELVHTMCLWLAIGLSLSHLTLPATTSNTDTIDDIAYTSMFFYFLFLFYLVLPYNQVDVPFRVELGEKRDVLNLIDDIANSGHAWGNA